jgi:hypothetical protein
MTKLMAMILMALGASLALVTAAPAASVPFQFDGLAIYQFGGPPTADFHFGADAAPDTGFIVITNNGTSTFAGTIGFNAIDGNGGDQSASYAVTLTPGQSATVTINGDSSNFCGYNGPCGDLSTPQQGAEFVMVGTVTLGANSAPVSLSIFDKDIHSGVFQTNPFGVSLDNYIMQGGDPFGRDTFDDFEVSQAPGHFQFTSGLSELSDAHLFIGLKNGDDQGTQFDLMVELLKNGTTVAQGLERCITGVTRNAVKALEAVVSWDPFTPVSVDSGDVLALRVSTRIGTNADGTKCSGPGGGHGTAAGLRLYYDSAARASGFDATIAPDSSENLYLHSNGSACPGGGTPSPGVTAQTLDSTAPTALNAKCADSGSLHFSGGNPFSIISTIGLWSLAAQP